jgi:hypothetical protein
LSFTIAKVEGDLNNGMSPQETKLSQRFPGRIAHHPGFQIQWDQVVIESSNQLVYLFKDKLKYDNKDIKIKMTEKMDTMKDAPQPSQFTKIKYKSSTKRQQADQWEEPTMTTSKTTGQKSLTSARRPYRQNQYPPNRDQRHHNQRREAPMRAPRRYNQNSIDNNE